ncbi:hypothetical protein [Gimesia chilikensis]|uniref:hypothetical protein n=1 Tax=Gimesia chilikensis TaxID=2605989 RepID=UPI003A8C90A4
MLGELNFFLNEDDWKFLFEEDDWKFLFEEDDWKFLFEPEKLPRDLPELPPERPLPPA